MAGKITANVLQLGDSVTATQNFVLQSNVDGSAKLARGNAGATTQDIMTVDASGVVAFPQTPAPSALSTASGAAPSYSARAWVNFNGTGTVAIRASGNVSSITDNGTGDYTINFMTAMPDANYVPSLGYGQSIPATYTKFCVLLSVSESGEPTLKTTTQLQVFSGGTGGADFANLFVSIFR